MALYLDNNAFSGALPKSWAAMTALLQLHLNDNMLVGEIPKEWNSLTLLQGLWLSNNLLTGVISNELNAIFEAVASGSSYSCNLEKNRFRCPAGTTAYSGKLGETSAMGRTFSFPAQ